MKVGKRASYPLKLSRALTSSRASDRCSSAMPAHKRCIRWRGRDSTWVCVMRLMLAELVVSGQADPGSAELLARFEAWLRAIAAASSGLPMDSSSCSATSALSMGLARNLGLLLFDLTPPAKSALAELEILVAPWEPCVTHFMTGDEVEALLKDIPESPEKTFSVALVEHARRTTVGYGGPDHFRFVDPLAIAAVIEPELVTKTLRASMDVSLAPGITRGMTVVDPTGRLGTPMVTIIEEAKVDRLVALYRASVAYRANT